MPIAKAIGFFIVKLIFLRLEELIAKKQVLILNIHS